MANVIREQRLVDSNKKAVLMYTVLSDGTQQSNTTLIDVSTLAFALNTNGYIMSSNTNPKATYRTTIQRIVGHGKISGAVHLKYEGDANGVISTIGNGITDINFDGMGGAITNVEANTVGDVLISTLGLAANDAFTLIIELRKSGYDYDQGRTADPRAFNPSNFT
jgi:hypothetical protein